MATLVLDALTASVAKAGLAARGHDLAAFAASLAYTRARWTARWDGPISTFGDVEEASEGLPAARGVLLVRPGLTPPEERPMAERFLDGAPALVGRLHDEGGVLGLETMHLRIGRRVVAVSGPRGRTFVVAEASLPATALAGAAGRRLGDLVDVAHGGDLLVRAARPATEAELAIHRTSAPTVAIETEAPRDVAVAFVDAADARARGS